MDEWELLIMNMSLYVLETKDWKLESLYFDTFSMVD